MDMEWIKPQMKNNLNNPLYSNALIITTRKEMKTRNIITLPELYITFTASNVHASGLTLKLILL